MEWKKIPVTSTSGISSHFAVSLSPEPTIVIFGGLQQDYSRKNSTITFDLESQKFSQTISDSQSINEKRGLGTFLIRNKKILPDARERHTLSLLDGNRVVLFGGIGDQKKRYNDVWILSTIPKKYQWYKPKIVSIETPSERYNHTCCVYKNSIYLFSGWDGNFKNDVWKLTEIKTDTFKWELINKGGNEDTFPLGRFQHSASIIDDKMYVFGGKYKNISLNDLWTFDLKNNQWTEIKMNDGDYIPKTRYGHTSCCIGNTLFILFGYTKDEMDSNKQYPTNILTFENGKFKEIDTNDLVGISPTGRITSTCCVVEVDKIFVYGGISMIDNKLKRTNDCWILETGLKKIKSIKSEKPMIGEYEILKRLGKGSQGIVYLVKDKNEAVFALKSMSIEENEDNETSKEVTLSAKLNHPNVLSIHRHFYVEKYGDYLLCLLMPYCDGGDLDEFLKKKRLTEKEMVNISVQIFDAISYCHKENVMHRDLKPQNIFISTDELKIKIADFGLAKNVEQSMAKSFVGTPIFMSPEIFSGEKYSFASDIYSLGAILFCIFSRYKKNVDFKIDSNYKVLEETLNETTLKFKDHYISIIKKCIQKNPQTRPQASELLEEFKLIEKELSSMKDEEFRLSETFTRLSITSNDGENPSTNSLDDSTPTGTNSTTPKPNDFSESVLLTPDKSFGSSFDENKSNSILNSNNDVSNWLKSIGMSKYESNFIDNGYDDLEIIKIDGLTDDEMVEIGINLIGHRKKIKVRVAELQALEK
eukprot:gene1470-12088_t